MKTCSEYEADFYKELKELIGEDRRYKGKINDNMAMLKRKASELEKKIDSLTEDAVGADLAGETTKAEKARKDAVTLGIELEQLQREIKALSRAVTPARLLKKLAGDIWNAAKLAHKSFEVEEKQRRDRVALLEKEIEERQQELEGLKHRMYSRGPSEPLAHSLWQPEVRSFIFGIVAPEPEPADDMSAETSSWEEWEIARMIRCEERMPPEVRKPEGVPYMDPWKNGGPREIHYDSEGKPYSLNSMTHTPPRGPSLPEAIREMKEGEY